MGIEKLTTLTFSMYTNKGAYALLLGAGISRSAHIPSGWEVVDKLIKQLAASQGITNSCKQKNTLILHNFWWKIIHISVEIYNHSPTRRIKISQLAE